MLPYNATVERLHRIKPMKHRLMPNARYFFATAPLPCPYLPGRTERRLVTELSGRQAGAFHDVLSQAGFRRSHCLAYVPVCRECSACAAVRVKALEFRPDRSQRRIRARNADLVIHDAPAVATEEQFLLFRTYQRTRHGDGEMARMTFYDYQTLVEDTPVETSVVELRGSDGALVAACLTDRMADGFSAVYSFFDPSDERRSLGTHVILTLIERACALQLPHVYLGFWIAECQKMSYKARFRPIEAYTPEGWLPLGSDDAEVAKYFQSSP
jgi:leucyl-tRNA---protein transferase